MNAVEELESIIPYLVVSLLNCVYDMMIPKCYPHFISSIPDANGLLLVSSFSNSHSHHPSHQPYADMDEDDRNVILPLRVTRRYSLSRGGVAHSSLSKMAHLQISPIHVSLLNLILALVAFAFVKICIVLSALSNIDVFKTSHGT